MVESLLIGGAILIGLLLFVGWLTSGSNPPPSNNPPKVRVRHQKRGGGTLQQGDSFNDIELIVECEKNGGPELDNVTVNFNGSSINQSLSGNDTQFSILADNIDTGTLSAGTSYNYGAELENTSNLTDNYNDYISVGSGPSSANPPQVDVNVTGSPSIGSQLSQINLNITAQAQGGKDLNQVAIELSDSNGNSWGPANHGMTGSNDNLSRSLAQITGSNSTINNPVTFNYKVIVEDSNGETNSAVGHININNGGGETEIDIDMQQILQALLAGNVAPGPSGNIVINNPQQQQQQQQMGGGGMPPGYGGVSPHIYNMLRQQMQQMQINQQQMMQQMMQFMQQNNYNEINNEVMVNFMQQIMNVDIDIGEIDIESGRSNGGDIKVQILQIFNNIDLRFIEETLIEIIEDIDISVSQTTEQEITFLFVKLLQLINQENFVIEGDKIIINTSEKNIEVEIDILIQYLNILTIIKKWELEKIVTAIVKNEIDIDVSLNTTLKQIIIFYRETDRKSGNRDRWTIFVKTIEKSDLPPQLRQNFIKLAKLEGNSLINNISPESLVLFRRVVNQLPIDQVEDNTVRMIEFLQNNNYSELNNSALIDATEFLRHHQPAAKTYINSNNYNGYMANGASQNVKTLIDEMKQEMKMDQQLVQDDKEIIEDLGEILQDIKRWNPVLEDLKQVDLPTNQHVSPEDFLHQMMGVVQSHEELGSQEASQQLLNDMQEIESDVEEIMKDLEEKKGLQQKEIEQENQIEDQIQVIEQRYIKNYKDGLKKLKRYKGKN